MSESPGRRGQPVAMLGLLLIGWVAARAVIVAAVPDTAGFVWQLAGPDGLPRSPALPGGYRPLSPTPREDPGRPADPAPTASVPAPLRPAPPVPPLPAPPPPAPPALAPRPRPAFEPVPIPVASGHLMLWMAGIARLAESGLAYPQAVPSGRPVPRAGLATFLPASAHRWSADGWLLLREGGSPGVAAGAGAPTYGASQAGAVARYRLLPGSPLRPAAYLRATAALGRVRDRELAAGVSARPLPAIPVTLAAEVRVADRPGPSRPRAAALAYTELPPFALDAGLRGETYAQAGYVGGRGHTAFADGQLRIDGRIGMLGASEVRGGGGAWGGAQKGAARLDIGPGVTIGVPVGDAASARLALDWRFRVAGDARPGAGPALTLSAGF